MFIILNYRYSLKKNTFLNIAERSANDSLAVLNINSENEESSKSIGSINNNNFMKTFGDNIMDVTENENTVKLFLDDIFNNAKKQIRLKEHELECYTNMHSRLYKTNYFLNF